MMAVVDDLAAYKIPSLLLSGGEPMIHPRFFDLIDYARSCGLKLTISTNGTLIDREKAARLKAAEVAYVGISLDGIGEVHDQFRGKQGAFKAAVDGFAACHDVGQKTGLRLTLTRHTVSDIERILDFIEQENIQRVCFYHLVPSGRGGSLQILRPEESRHALDTLIDRVDRWNRAGIRREVLTVTQPADGPYLLLRMQQEDHPGLAAAHRLLMWNGGGNNSSGRGLANIDTQGNVHPDQFWQSVTLGNIKRTPFSTIWEAKNPSSADELREIRSVSQLDSKSRHLLMQGRCSECRWFSICGGGFRTRAANACGNIWGSDPGCYLSDAEIHAEALAFA
jgi:radical SAM protein with 4Fe4S-binding SPASM domain